MQNIKYEIRPVVGYEGLYSVSNDGRVFSHNYRNTGQTQEMKPGKDKHGYLHVDLSQDGKTKRYFIHRLVLQAFVCNPENKPCCDHIDANKTNNYVSNLRWCTYKENNNNPITRKKNSAGQRGRTPSKETRRKISEGNKDKTIYTFRNKSTSQVFVGTRYEFYTKYNLDKTCVYYLIKGKQKTHRKWILI